MNQSLVCLALLCCGVLSSKAQGDSLYRPFRDSIGTLQSSLKDRLETGTVAQRIDHIQDTAKHFQQRLDTVKQWMSGEVSALQKEFTGRASKITQLQQKLQSRVDSLSRLSLSDNKLTSRLDSINQRLGSLHQEFESKISATKNQAMDKLGKIEVPPEWQSQVNELQTSISKMVPGEVSGNLSFDVPGIDVLTKGLPSLSSVGTSGITDALKIPKGIATPDNLAIPNTNIPNVNAPLPTNLSMPGTDQVSQLAKVSDVTEQSQKALGDLNAIKAQPIDKIAESKMTSLDEVKEIQKRAKLEGVEAIQSPEALKAEMKRQAQAVAVDHFSDKQAELKAAMEKISKYKLKYNEMKSITDLAKKPSNPLKEKKFYERLLPGVGFQILKKNNDILVDFNPYVGYKITSKIVAGVGWNQRAAYNWDQKSFSPQSRIYGPRLYGEYNLSKGFSPRLEVEVMNTLVPPTTVKQGDPYDRQWVPGAFAGIKKQYKIYKQLRGTATVMFRLYDPKRQSPYGDVVNARFGLEYVLKKKKAAEKKLGPQAH
ncbi:MAG: hypothetical protein QM762_13245 [Chryseolinea sp.]